MNRLQQLAGLITESQLNEVEGKDLNSYGKVLFDRLKKNGFDPKFVKSSGEFNNLSKIVKDKKDAKLAAVLYDDMGNPGDGYIMIATNEGNHDEVGKMLDSIKFELPDGGKHFEDSAWTWQINGSSFAKKPQSESLDIEEVVNEALKSVRK